MERRLDQPNYSEHNDDSPHRARLLEFFLVLPQWNDFLKNQPDIARLIYEDVTCRISRYESQILDLCDEQEFKCVVMAALVDAFDAHQQSLLDFALLHTVSYDGGVEALPPSTEPRDDQ